MPPAIHTIHCRPDDEGDVVATLVHYPSPAPARRAVLYLHGFVDYFFQEHVASAFAGRGFDFYALDLRKYGRSLRPHQHPNFCRSLNEYAEEISEAIVRMEADGVSDLTLLGHSTGGLIAGLYAARGALRTSIRRIVLNSPFLEFNESPLVRTGGSTLSSLVADRSPYFVVSKGLSPFYGESLHKDYRGEWDYRLSWKPIEGYPVYAAWLRAIREGQARMQKGMDLPMPILLLHSDRSVKAEKRWRDEFAWTDAVLDVDHMRKYGPRMGSRVELCEIAGGMHDLFLSRPDVREKALTVTLDWIERLVQLERSGQAG